MISPNPTVSATYPQDWPSYNLAQQNEKERFLVLLRDLCNTVPQPSRGRGRPRLPISDVLLATTYKVYAGFSARRFTSDIQAAKQGWLIDHAPHFNSTNRYLANPALTPLLRSLIAASASPLKAVEVDFAIDSTGFATTTYSRWFDHKWGKERIRQTWVKTHLMVGELPVCVPNQLDLSRAAISLKRAALIVIHREAQRRFGIRLVCRSTGAFSASIFVSIRSLRH